MKLWRARVKFTLVFRVGTGIKPLATANTSASSVENALDTFVTTPVLIFKEHEELLTDSLWQ